MITNSGMSPMSSGNAKRYARIVIGTSSFSSIYTKDDVDYLCDGVDDQIEINSAIQELISLGPDCTGEIVLLDGVYNLSDKILIDGAGGTNTSGLVLTSSGKVTLTKGFNENVSDNGGMILVTNSSNVTIKNILLDGVKTSYPSSYYNSNVGIKLGFGTSSNNGIVIDNCTIYNFGDYGVMIGSGIGTKIFNCTVTNCLYGIFILDKDTQVINNRFDSNATYGIYVNANNARILNNVCTNHTSPGNGAGIITENNGSYAEIVNNRCEDNYNGISINASYALVQGNYCRNSVYYNIKAYYRCNIVGNYIFGKVSTGTGIFISNSYCTVVGNTILNTNYSIHLENADGCNIVGNMCMDFNTTGIYLYGENKLTVVTGNTCRRGSGNASDYTSSQRTIYLYMTSFCCVTNNIIAGKAITNTSSNNLTSENNLTGISGGPVTGS